MKASFTLLLTALSLYAIGQQTFTETLDPFHKLVVDPYINVELVQGDEEKIEVEYSGVDPNEIFVEHHNKTLRVFLADARLTVGLFADEDHVERKYRHSQVWMKITYKTLKNIQFRGEGELVCNGLMSGRKLKLKAYGETKVYIQEIDYDRLKIALYGDNDLKIAEGQAYDHIVNTYGENRVDVSGIISHGVRSNSFGENRVALNAIDHLKVLHIGEGELRYAGSPIISSKWVIGEVDVRRIR